MSVLLYCLSIRLTFSGIFLLLKLPSKENYLYFQLINSFDLRGKSAIDLAILQISNRYDFIYYCVHGISRECEISSRSRFTTRLSPEIKRTRIARGFKKSPRRSPTVSSRIHGKSRRSYSDDRKRTGRATSFVQIPEESTLLPAKDMQNTHVIANITHASTNSHARNKFLCTSSLCISSRD